MASTALLSLQALARGAVARQSFSQVAAARKDQITPVIRHIAAFQGVVRGALARTSRASERRVVQASSDVVRCLQAQARGALSRRHFGAHLDEIYLREEVLGLFAARAQGALARRQFRSKASALAEVNVHEGFVRFGALARSALARREVAKVKAEVNVVAPSLIGFQARAKAQLVRRNHQQLAAALANVSTISSALKSQSIFRAALSRARKGEQKKEVEFVLPNFVGFQAAARRAYQKGEHDWWSDHVRSHAFVAVRLQTLLRGAMVRKAFYGRLNHFYRNMEAVVRLQAIRRGKGPREGFNGIRLGKNVKVATIKNFGHLLDDNDAESKDEALLGALRQDVVAVFRESQALEADAEELDQSIGLFAQNIAQFQGRTRTSTDSRPVSSFVDPFNASSLDRAAQHKLDLYQQLFYMLQTRSDLLGKLCARLSADVSDPSRKLVESVVLALFGYGQGKREEYWAMMFFQVRLLGREASADPPPSPAPLPEVHLNPRASRRSFRVPSHTRSRPPRALTTYSTSTSPLQRLPSSTSSPRRAPTSRSCSGHSSMISSPTSISISTATPSRCDPRRPRELAASLRTLIHDRPSPLADLRGFPPPTRRCSRRPADLPGADLARRGHPRPRDADRVCAPYVSPPRLWSLGRA